MPRTSCTVAETEGDGGDKDCENKYLNLGTHSAYGIDVDFLVY